ncbi:MAG TPA: DMT family transporter [Nitrospiria bacterium]|nr:DMT family transporter [Nitrospiria bacterium]
MARAGTNAPSGFRVGLHTACALLAFAANSVLCRLALGNGTIDAASFTAIRLTAGAAALWLLVRVVTPARDTRPRGDWASAAALCLYAVGFSFAYLSLSAGTGALVLFGAVQSTMILAGLRSGERPHPLQWAGLLAAAGGLVALVFPGLTAPSPAGAALMAVAGVAWGVYSLRGRGATDPIAVTADNFIRSVPLVLLVVLATFRTAHLSPRGVWLAVLSGSLASGIGYVLWYAALRGLTATRAATVQLAVPVLVAFAGVLFLAEAVSPRLIISAILILGGVGLTLVGRNGAE